MKRFLAWIAVSVLAATGALADSGHSGRDKENDDKRKDKQERNILEFDTMIGVPRPYIGADNAIRGVAGGGLPWVVGSARGELKINGHLEIEIRGLVFDPNDATVIARGLANQNTVATFRAVVSCLSKDASGAPSTVNVMTGTFPATTGFASAGGGNATIDAVVQLPTPCIAPIVFVTSPTGAWFATTGM